MQRDLCVHSEANVWKDVQQEVTRDSYFWVRRFGVISFFVCFSTLSEF